MVEDDLVVDLLEGVTLRCGEVDLVLTLLLELERLILVELLLTLVLEELLLALTLLLLLILLELLLV